MQAVNWILPIIVVGGLAAILGSFRAARRREKALARLELVGRETVELDGSVAAFPARWRWAGPACGLCVLLFLAKIFSVPLPFAVAFGILVGVLATLAEEYWAASRIALIEEQLAVAIDLMVSTLRAGMPLQASLEIALEESRQPIRNELEEVTGRFRLGEDPQNVIRQLAQRVPLDAFRLFSHTFLVHLETGGSLANTLMTIGRTIRDRIEVARRVRAQAVESQVSVVAVLAITYGLLALIFFTNPVPLSDLIKGTAGTYIAAAAIILQSIGILWIWRMSQIRF
ncbi:MAG: type II secretion system F family protein [Acidobacteria bacterium]|nr:type II secretion system F family protein [Acidobacteriota bacterium]